MGLQPLSLPTLLTFAALLFSNISLWSPYRYAWAALCAVAVALGYIAGILSGPAILPIVGLAIACWLYSAQKTSPAFFGARTLLAIGIIVLALLLGVHVLPGFHNPVYVKDLVLSPGAAPYTRSLTFDTWVVGTLLLGLCYPRERFIRSLPALIDALKAAIPVIALTLIIVVPLALFMGFVHFDPKLTTYYWIWALVYFFFVILTEEALFRGFIQRELTDALQEKPFGAWIAIAITSVLFGAVHFEGGWSYVFLATLAGVGYGVTFYRSGRIEMSILAHFALNSTRFLLFTYPYLA